MKQTILPFLLVIFSAATAKDNVSIHGHIQNQLADSIVVSYSLTSIKYEPIGQSSRLVNGDFRLSFSVPDGYTNLTITNGGEQTEIYVQPGADLTLTVDAGNFDSTIHYEGTGNEIANFMAKCVLEKHVGHYVNQRAQMLANKDLEPYKVALKELQESESAFIEKNGNSLPPSFKEYLNKSNQYNIYYTMHMYPHRREESQKKSSNAKSISAENYAVIDDIPASFDDKYLNMSEYQAYLKNFYMMRVLAENARNDVKIEVSAIMDTVFARAYREMPPLSAEYFVGNRMYNSMQRTPIGEILREYDGYKKHFPKSKNLPILEKAIDGRRLIGAGKPEIDFDITTPEGRKMKLSDLKGKVVYLDFWSRGCVPCINEMKDAKKVRDHFKDKPVAFVYVSEDENDSVWRMAIKQFEIDGINTRLDKGKTSELVQKYEAGSIPCHFLIDREGKFAKVEYVESPSEKEKLIGQIKKLLE